MATHTISNEVVEQFFFGSSTPDCELPCWQGLVIGQSNSDDVYKAFDRAFQLGGLPYIRADFSNIFPRHIRLSYRWEQTINSDVGQSIFAAAFVDPYSDSVDLLQFDFSSTLLPVPYPRIGPDLSTAQILRELGRPFFWEMAAKGGGQGSHIVFKSFMVYENGISFYQYVELPAYRVTDSVNTDLLSAQLCLSENLDVTVFITNPLVDGFTDLTEFEDEIYKRRNGLKPIENVIGVSSEELADQIELGINPCVEIRVPE